MEILWFLLCIILLINKLTNKLYVFAFERVRLLTGKHPPALVSLQRVCKYDASL